MVTKNSDLFNFHLMSSLLSPEYTHSEDKFKKDWINVKIEDK